MTRYTGLKEIVAIALFVIFMLIYYFVLKKKLENPSNSLIFIIALALALSTAGVSYLGMRSVLKNKDGINTKLGKATAKNIPNKFKDKIKI